MDARIPSFLMLTCPEGGEANVPLRCSSGGRDDDSRLLLLKLDALLTLNTMINPF
jgi:hypothetical protein